MDSSASLEKELEKLSRKVLAPGLPPAKKKQLEARIKELNRQKHSAQQKEIEAERPGKKSGLFNWLRTSIFGGKSSSAEGVVGSGTESLEQVSYKTLEKEVTNVLHHPDTLPSFMNRRIPFFIRMLNAPGLSTLEDEIDHNLDNNFRLVHGSKVPTSLKKKLTIFFTEYYTTITNVIHAHMEVAIKNMEGRLPDLSPEEIQEYVRLKQHTLLGPVRISALIETYSSVITVKNDPQKAFNELSDHWYRSLNILLQEEGVRDIKGHLENIVLTDIDQRKIWDMYRKTIIEKLAHDSHA